MTSPNPPAAIDTKRLRPIVPSAAVESPSAIHSIEIVGLFGLFDYRLHAEDATAANLSKLLVLYGDNGSGKTTLLRLVYHLLSPEDNRGHRSAIAPVPFRRFAVRLGSDVLIEAERPSEALTGAFTMRVTDSHGEVTEAFLPVNENGVVVIPNEDKKTQRDWAMVVARLQSLGISLYYLPDNRRAQSPQHREEDSSDQELTFGFEQQLLLRRARQLQGQDESTTVLDAAVRRTEEWLRFEAIRAASIGEADTNKVYAEIVKRIARSGGGKKTTSGQAQEILRSLTDLEDRSKAYSDLGLMPPLNVVDLVSAFQNATGQKQQFMSEVLRPYVDSLAARLNALNSIQELLKVFLESVNEFFTNKVVAFDISRGLSIRSTNGQVLTPAVLSSGERQLLLLFCNTITARQQASIFIIDEPEISLNVKWQRRLLKALLSIVRGTPVQFLVATHSIELLAQYRRNVLRLQSTRPDAD